MIEWTITAIIAVVTVVLYCTADLYRKAEETRDENKKLHKRTCALEVQADAIIEVGTRRLMHHKHGPCGDVQVIVPEYDLFNEEPN